jgi:hypothetical protein
MEAPTSANLTPAPAGRARPARRHRTGVRVADWQRPLAATPAVRTAAVLRAQTLIADKNYPPLAVVNEVALFLAGELAAAATRAEP